MGIAKYLKRGPIEVLPGERKISINHGTEFLYYDDLTPSDWGYVYEKYVGQVLESEGHEVRYHGLDLGFLDQGIDLISRHENTLYYIQCKFVHQPLGKARIEWLLYYASRKLQRAYEDEGKPIVFMLIVSETAKAFRAKKLPKSNRGLVLFNKPEYPMLQYFLSHNNTQSKVRVSFREINMLM